MTAPRPVGVILNDVQHVTSVEDFAALGREFNAAAPIFIAQINEACRPIMDALVQGVQNARMPR